MGHPLPRQPGRKIIMKIYEFPRSAKHGHPTTAAAPGDQEEDPPHAAELLSPTPTPPTKPHLCRRSTSATPPMALDPQWIENGKINMHAREFSK